VLFELRVKEHQFEEALAASLELSFETTVSEAPQGGRGGGRGDELVAAAVAVMLQLRRLRLLLQQKPHWRRSKRSRRTRRRADVHDRDPRQSFAVSASLFNQSPENLALKLSR